MCAQANAAVGDPPLFDRAALESIAARHARAYRSAEPFPHIVLDDLFPAQVLEEVLREFPGRDELDWTHYDRGYERGKFASRGDRGLGPATRRFFAELHSPAFLDFLEKLTGIRGIIPDPHLEGGGLHEIEPGGYLQIHADFNRHKRLQLDRRLNLLVFLNKDWQEDFGGHLELWTRDMQRCAERVLPLFNRTVLFSTSDWSYHGHPDPLRCPEGRTRRSLALYYYTNGRPRGERSAGHMTEFRFRPGEPITWGYDVVLTKLVPPILLDLGRWLRDRLARRP